MSRAHAAPGRAWWWLATFLALLGADAHARQPVDLEPFLARDSFAQIVISPTGEYYATTVPQRDRTNLVIVRRADMQVTANLRVPRDNHIHEVDWVSPGRVVASIAQAFGRLDSPSLTGELYAVDADGSAQQLLAGYRSNRSAPAFLLGTLPDDPRNVLVTVWPVHSSEGARVEKLDVYTGKRTRVASPPLKSASYSLDGRGRVRFARASEDDNLQQLFHRPDDASAWTRINHERDSGVIHVPWGFSADDRTAYLQVERASGPDAVEAFDTLAGTRREVARDALVDPAPIYAVSCGACPQVVGARFHGPRPRMVFFDEASTDARLYRALERAFPGQIVQVTSATTDGRLLVVAVESDVDPGSFYLYDTQAKRAAFIFARRMKIDPQAMARTQPIALTARDGLPLHGFLTVPRGQEGGAAPLVVLPHGGPFGIYDRWGFDEETQMLARAGYAVLRLNFRGSGNYGRAFLHAGARQWGGAMQDDLTDATRWAIGQGIADAGRICIYGASYGAYAALMGAAKEPGLYRCAIGYVGVYDLVRMRNEGRWAKSGRNWSQQWLGDSDAALAAVSPDRLAAQIKVPVFLAAGGADAVAPIEHTRSMARALEKAGVPVEKLYYVYEGHGFYEIEHQRAYYTQLLAFLARHLGGHVAQAGPGGDAKP